MADAKHTTYVKAVDANVLVKRSTVVSDKTITAEKASRDVWAQTVLMVHVMNPLDEDFDATKDIKVLAEDIRKAFKANFTDAYGDLPKTGINGRTGDEESMDGGKKGFKWSSWAGSYLSINYCSQIAHIVKAGIVEDVIDERKNGTYRVVNKTQAIKMAREALASTSGSSENPENDENPENEESNTTPLDAIRQALALIEAQLPELKDADEIFEAAGDIESVFLKADALTAEATEEA